MPKKQDKQKSKQEQTGIAGKTIGCQWNMSRAAEINQNPGVVQMLPLIFFTAVVILIVRMVTYTRPLERFYWAVGNTHSDFFSYCKMAAIITCAAVVIVFISYRVFTKTLAIKKTYLYIPMLVYSVLVILSYTFSEYREFSLLGFNERFEGTLVLLSYMVMLFYAINTINSEKAVRYILYPVAASSFLLGLIGISQAIGRDFFRTTVGLMLILPKSYWDKMDQFVFRFADNQIYQTVYNINYVSFYLTLILPVFGLLFINSIMKGKQEKPGKKIIWGGLVLLLVFNLIGSASSGGYLGMGIAVAAAIVILRKKIPSWRKPVAVLAVITLIIGGITFNRWLPELTSAIKGTLMSDSQSLADKALKDRRHIDYLEVISKENTIKLSIEGNEVTFILHSNNGVPSGMDVLDVRGDVVDLNWPDEEKNIRFTNEYSLNDNRFKGCAFRLLKKDEKNYLVITTDGQSWIHLIANDGVYYLNNLGKQTEMKKIAAIGFKKNQMFGSGRGYIWSRTIPMMLDTVLIGRGADTFCLYFPHNDYVGRYNVDFGMSNIVDKPHNMYMQMSVGTGGISLIAFLALLAVYFVQSYKIYRAREFDGFIDCVGLGIFLGILGFSVTGLVNDSSVSVMPLFYGLLGAGIAVNMMMATSETPKIKA